MTPPVPVTERRWYRIVHWVTAVSAFAALTYFIAQSRGWLPGDPGPASTRFGLASSTCFIWSLLLLRRSSRIAVVLTALAALFLAWSVFSLSRGN